VNEDLELFADDYFITRSNKKPIVLITDMAKALEGITKWLTHCGLKVNMNKTDACLFYKQDIVQISG
jgi:hypothetical protein